MDIPVILKGAVVGFSLAAPVGPIGLLAIRRTLADGRVAGLVTGLGAAVADALYGLLAGVGVGAISEALASGMPWMRLGGGVFLCILGTRTAMARPADRPADAGATGLLGAFGSTLVLTLTNPMTILSFAAVFAAVGLGAGAGAASVAAFVAAVFAGSAVWWLLLSGGVGLLRGRVTTRAMRAVNKASGVLLVGFGLVALAGMLW